MLGNDVRRLLACCLFMAGLAAASSHAHAAPVETVRFAGPDGTSLTGYLARPARPTRTAKRPAVIALHGCGGPLNRRKTRLGKRHAAWADILTRAGYVVLFPDSFGSRGHGSLCRMRPRPVGHRLRMKDVHAARKWLRQQAFVNPSRIAVLGWSNGGSTALRVAAARGGRHYRAIIAYYPGCRRYLNRQRRSAAPLTILIGGADNWTPAGPCQALAGKWRARIIVYPGAHHGFDSPRSRVRTLKGMAYSQSGNGSVRVGTHPVARRQSIATVLTLLRQALGR